MKKTVNILILFLATFGICLVNINAVTATNYTSNKNSKYLIKTKKTYKANAKGIVVIKGTAEPNRYVKVGIFNTKTDKKGHFKLKYSSNKTETQTVKIGIFNDRFDQKAINSKKIKITSPYNKIKLGMSQKDVIKILGRPSSKSSTDLKYGSQSLTFSEDKLIFGTPNQLTPKISSSVSESNKNKTKKEPTDQQKQQAQEEHIRSFARTFGNKPAQEVQEKSYAYSSRNIAGLGMVYMWKVDKDILMRIDGSDNITSVYLYDKNAENGKGQLLYQGHTIINKQKKQYNFYN